jgi:hypothetical protein
VPLSGSWMPTQDVDMFTPMIVCSCFDVN